MLLDVEDDGGGQAEQSSDEGKCESPSDDIVVRFALTKGEGDWPEKSELSDDEKHDPALLALFNLNWDPDGAVDLGDVEIESCEVIFDGVTYSETLEEGLKTIDRISGLPSQHKARSQTQRRPVCFPMPTTRGTFQPGDAAWPTPSRPLSSPGAIARHTSGLLTN